MKIIDRSKSPRVYGRAEKSCLLLVKLAAAPGRSPSRWKISRATFIAAQQWSPNCSIVRLEWLYHCRPAAAVPQPLKSQLCEWPSCEKRATFLAFRSKTDPPSGRQWTRNESLGLLLSGACPVRARPPPSPPARSLLRDCCIVEGVRPFRGRFFLRPKPFRRRPEECPSEKYTPGIYLRVGDTRPRAPGDQSEKIVRAPWIMLYGSSSTGTRDTGNEDLHLREACFEPPSFGSHLSALERQVLVTYLRTLFARE